MAGLTPFALGLQRVIAVKDPLAEGAEFPEGADSEAARHAAGSAAASQCRSHVGWLGRRTPCQQL